MSSARVLRSLYFLLILMLAVLVFASMATVLAALWAVVAQPSWGHLVTFFVQACVSTPLVLILLVNLDRFGPPGLRLHSR